MGYYTWPVAVQDEANVVGSRLADQIRGWLGVSTYSSPAAKDAALAELIAAAWITGTAGDGATDDTAAINAALATMSPGETLTLPFAPLGYKIDGTLLVPQGVTFDGGGRGLPVGRWTNGVGIGGSTVPGGTMLKITSTTASPIQLGNGSQVRGFTFWYPNQNWAVTALGDAFVTYPATILLGTTSGVNGLFGPQVRDCLFLGATIGVEQYDQSGQSLNSFVIENCAGTVLGPLLKIYQTSDAIRLRNITISPSYTLNFAVDGDIGGDGKVFRTKMAQVAKIFEFGHVPDVDASDVYGFGVLYFGHYKAGMITGDTDEEGGGRFVSCLADVCQAMFRVERSSNISPLSLTNCWATPVFRPNGVAGDKPEQALISFAAGVSNYRVAIDSMHCRGGSLDASYVAGYTDTLTNAIRADGALGAQVNVLIDHAWYTIDGDVADANCAAITSKGFHALLDVLQPLDVPSVTVSDTQVVGAQGAAVADATDAASTQARLNDLLARLRTHGLIAT